MFLSLCGAHACVKLCPGGLVKAPELLKTILANRLFLRTGQLLNAGTTRGGIFGLIEEFLLTIDARLVELLRVLDESDFRGLATIAQSVERDAKSFGAARIGAVAMVLIEACEQADYESADRYARRLPRVARDTAAVMREYVKVPQA